MEFSVNLVCSQCSWAGDGPVALYLRFNIVFTAGCPLWWFNAIGVLLCVCVCVRLSVHGLQSKREKFSSVENCIYNISSLFRAKETTEETEKLVQTLSANGKYRKWKTLSSTNYIYVYNTNIQTQRKIEV